MTKEKTSISEERLREIFFKMIAEYNANCEMFNHMVLIKEPRLIMEIYFDSHGWKFRLYAIDGTIRK